MLNKPFFYKAYVKHCASCNRMNGLFSAIFSKLLLFFLPTLALPQNHAPTGALNYFSVLITAKDCLRSIAKKTSYFSYCAFWSTGQSGSTTTDCDKLTTNQRTANKLTANNANWLKRAILNLFLLIFPEPSCPNSHFVMKSL